MTRKILLLLALPLALGACGQSAADAELSKMHDAMMEQFSENMMTSIISGPSRTTSTFHLVGENNIEGVGTGKADITITGDVSSDVRKKDNPLVDATLGLAGTVSVPSGTFSGNPQGEGAPEKISADVEINGRTVDKTFLVHIPKLSISAPLLPVPFVLPKEISDLWYGMTFSEIDRLLSEQSTEENEPLPPVSELITTAFSNNFHPESIKKLFSKIHVWKGVDMLPSEDGLIKIRVESDKKKIQKSVAAFVTYINEASSGQSWSYRMAGNKNLQEQLSVIEDDDSEFMKTMGTLKGVLSLDAETYQFRGFDGDMIDANGTVKGHIFIAVTDEKDVNIKITESEKGDAFTFTKTGEDISLKFNEDEVMNGKVSSSFVNLTLKDPKTGAEALHASMKINESSESSLSISEGIIEIPKEQVVIRVNKLMTTVQRDSGDVTIHFNGSWDKGDSQHFSIVSDVSRTSIDSLDLNKEVYKPLQSLYQDLLQTLMSTGSPPNY